MIKTFVQSLFWAYLMEFYFAFLEYILPNRSGVFPFETLYLAMVITFTLFSIILFIHLAIELIKYIIKNIIKKLKHI